MTIPLVRTEGKAFANGPTLSAQRFIALPQLDRASKTKLTRDAERDLGLGDCLYFYVGHACPDFGDLVLAYASNMADADDGNATAFDTGGLSVGLVHARDLDNGENKATYCNRHLVDLNAWRPMSAGYVAEYFGSTVRYVTGEQPIKDDPSGRLRHPENNDRRSWTWEIRIWRNHPIERSLLKAWSSPDYFEGVRQALRGSVGSSGDRCADLLASGKLIAIPPGEPVHRQAEGEMATWT